MNILMLSDVYFPRINGVSTSIRASIQWLLRNGHTVTLVAPDYGTGADQAAHDAEFGSGLEVLRVPARTIFFDPEDRLIKASAMSRVVARLHTRHWDAIHVHTPFRAHQMGVRLGRSIGVAVVETYHTYFEEYVAHYLPWMPQRMLRYGARQLSRRLCDAVDHLIVPTAEMTAVLKGYGVRTPTTVLPTGIDLNEFRGGDGRAFRERHGIPQARPLLVTVSRLAVEKNIAFLLEVMSELIDEIPDALFIIAGEGPDAPRLKTMVKTLGLEDNVRFFGNLDRRTELKDCYRAGHAFVFASPTETQGLVLIEAMALGVPIVSTAVMGTATVLRNANSALISPEEAPAFADAIAGVLREPALREALALAGPRDAIAWSSERLMAQAAALYAGLTPRRVKGGRTLVDPPVGLGSRPT